MSIMSCLKTRIVYDQVRNVYYLLFHAQEVRNVHYPVLKSQNSILSGAQCQHQDILIS